MDKITSFIDGRKTYIAAGLIFIIGGLHALKIINDNSYQSVLSFVGAFALFGIRSAISKIEKK